MLPLLRHGRAYNLASARSGSRHSQAGAVPLCCPGHAIHRRQSLYTDRRFSYGRARITGSACRRGNPRSIFREQLCDGWLWRWVALAKLASIGAGESLTGVLMCGVSASLLFAIVTWLIGKAQSGE